MQGGVGEIYKSLNYFRQHTAKVTVSSARSGGGIREGFYVIQRIEREFPSLNRYKKSLRRGKFYRGIKRSPAPQERKMELFKELSDVLGGTVSDYRLERFNQFLRIMNPFLLTPGRDRLCRKSTSQYTADFLLSYLDCFKFVILRFEQFYVERQQPEKTFDAV